MTADSFAFQEVYVGQSICALSPQEAENQLTALYSDFWEGAEVCVFVYSVLRDICSSIA
jgi:hypothetical protein